MKQIIPFNKEITLKNKIKELTSISLDNDLTLKGEDLITGNFYLSGTYQTTEKEETYSYKIPCEIAISDDYDTYNASIDIDDFNYDVNQDKLNISISLAIDGLEKKEIEEEIEIKKETREDKEEKKEERCIDEEELKELETINNKKIIQEEKIETTKIENKETNYYTYSVYIVKEDDTINTILEKYNITKDSLEEYNELENIKSGNKIIIPYYAK